MRKRKELFRRTYNALMEAKNLRRGDLSYCAVGQIVVAAENSRDGTSKSLTIPYWASVIQTKIGKTVAGETVEVFQHINKKAYKGAAKRQIDCTGFTVEELARIEMAFESTLWWGDEEKDADIGRYDAICELREICGMQFTEEPEKLEYIILNIT